jgi:excisionase family DNA binding protein
LPGTTADAPQLLNVPETADYLRLCEMTVYRMLERGELPGVKVAGRWRVRRVDLDALLAGEPR